MIDSTMQLDKLHDRNPLRAIGLLAMALVLTAATDGALGQDGQSAVPAKPTPQQAAWQDMELGMFIHFGLWSCPQGIVQEARCVDGIQFFNPTKLDTDQWVRVAELMEMYYQSVGHGAVLLLNHTPDTTGLIPEADFKRGAGVYRVDRTIESVLRYDSRLRYPA